MKNLTFWRATLLFGLIAVLLLALLPTGDQMVFSGQDKLLHGITFAVLFLLSRQSLPAGASLWLIYPGLMGYGILMEVLQGLTGYRYMEGMDLLADLLGLMVGHLVVLSIRKAQRKLQVSRL
ncbi:hypothetical protein [Porticoccus hydrocarbonoclasticus]|jgi:VanZ family protein|uniref:hypothetical protein n=1 Tax=Porticoccus hydrocarbonoclasticus TaxID=1073414 RepID=UPI00235792EB|nr:hypothetical protein [Porticoccus hydrocarbonoclasticus]|tara:strand:- start:3305 stop:3670 length:366 start_codon:yes stop_codon:yes gene_type:complete